MTKLNTKSKKGFTIIEVVLVLAIAGLIFLMVFVALPALQRSQRDTQRRQDMSRLITAVQNYQSNNKSQAPSFDSSFISSYITGQGDTFQDPSGSNYEFAGTTECKTGEGGCKASALTDTYKIQAYTNAVCDGEQPKYQQGKNRVAFVLKLEGAGYYCVNN